ncbi:DUF3558 domain-containing protein [Mycobacterium branderi]|nr:DUF3558 domain-containing protein [Mycobacterium branderi]BBZ15111.1 putative lipoprotein LprB [Mycobacterium branderi]
MLRLNSRMACTAAMIPLLAACSALGAVEQRPAQPSAPTAPAQGSGGPFFPLCGGISDQVVTAVTQQRGLINTAQSSVGCQWLAGGDVRGSQFSFSWYRGSPIGRERRIIAVDHTSVEDISIDGHDGVIAKDSQKALGDNFCEIAIGFAGDFIEWTVDFQQKPFPDPCGVVRELTHQSIAHAK